MKFEFKYDFKSWNYSIFFSSGFVWIQFQRIQKLLLLFLDIMRGPIKSEHVFRKIIFKQKTTWTKSNKKLTMTKTKNTL